MADRFRTMIFHNAEWEALEVNADDIVAVEDVKSKRQSPCRTRILLSSTNAEGENEELLVREAAENVSQQLVHLNGAANLGSPA